MEDQAARKEYGALGARSKYAEGATIGVPIMAGDAAVSYGQVPWSPSKTSSPGAGRSGSKAKRKVKNAIARASRRRNRQ